MHKERKRWISLVVMAAIVLAGAIILYFHFHLPVWALEFYYRDTTLEDFNAGFFYHTALSLREDGEVQLLPVGLGQEWSPATPLPVPRAGAAAVYYDNHIYVVGGDSEFGLTHNDSFYTAIYTDVLTVTERLAGWITTTALPSNLYPDGLYRHDGATVNGYVYVLGGKEDKGVESTVYDTVVFAPIQGDGSLGAWQETTPLPLPLFALESVVLNGRIYAMGGADTSGNSHTGVYVAEPDPFTGQISAWTPMAALPALVVGGFYDSAAAELLDRIYIYGGGKSVVGSDYSPYVHFAEPVTTTGVITEWIWIDNPPLPQNCFASEGAAYDAGLLLAVAGAWNNVVDPSGDVRAALVDRDTGWTGEWVSTIGLDPGRFWHAVVQDDQGWLYSIGGTTGSTLQRLSEVQAAPPYSVGGSRKLQHTQASTPTVYAPDGTFTSQQRALEIAEAPARLQSLAWNTTITDSATMSITMYYRYHRPNQAWTDWFGPFPSLPGDHVTTSIEITGTADYFQYRIYVTTTVVTQTPLLHLVRIGVLAPPDLVADDLTATGCDTCPDLIPPDEPVQIEFTVHNRSTSLRFDNNFFAMAFITTDPDYLPLPPDCPAGCDCSQPETCPLIWSLQGYDYEETDPPVVLTTTWTFDEPGTFYVVACIDYNDAPAEPPPFYDVHEFEEFNNCMRFVANVGEKSIFLPLVTKD